MAININEERFEQHLDDLFKSYGVKGALVNFFVDESGNYWMLTDDDVLLYRDYAGGKTVEFLKDVSMNGDMRDRLLDIAVVNRQVFLFYNSSLMVCYDLETSRELYRELFPIHSIRISHHTGMNLRYPRFSNRLCSTCPTGLRFMITCRKQ